MHSTADNVVVELRLISNSSLNGMRFGTDILCLESNGRVLEYDRKMTGCGLF